MLESPAQGLLVPCESSDLTARCSGHTRREGQPKNKLLPSVPTEGGMCSPSRESEAPGGTSIFTPESERTQRWGTSEMYPEAI